MSPLQYGHPIFSWPPQPKAIAGVFFGFPGLLWPWPALYLALACIQWLLVGHPIAAGEVSLARFSALYAVNLVALIAFVLTFYYVLYVRRVQGLKFKYSGQWPEKKNRRFLFASEMLEGILLSCISAVAIWTLYTFGLLWMYSEDMLLRASWSENPIWCVFVFLLFPFWANVHFYFTHRWLHGRALSRFHRVHHKAMDISPWSGLSMHPVEHLIYFSAVPIYVLMLPNDPILMMYYMVASALGPTTLHHGFAAVKLGKDRLMLTDHHHHYLHHQAGSTNFGATNLVPLDTWLKTDYQTAQRRKAMARTRATANA